MSEALYRKYRSKRLGDIVGQDHVTDILASALKNDKTSHAYLLTGPRGVGKTSIARILAHEINNLPYDGTNHLDIIEIDAASNNSVDDIRDLREKVLVAPASAKKKIYVIDEVHMLSKPAFNALLKTLEEPPEHVVFILATTEVHKIPDTILSRAQRFHFRAISASVMQKHLKAIADKEKIAIDDDALLLIAERASGSFRDGISLLDQVKHLADKKITRSKLESYLGIAPQELIVKLFSAIVQKKLSEAVALCKNIEESGISASIAAEQLSTHIASQITDHPSLITVLSELIEVNRSSDPFLKLLAVVSKASASSEDQVKTVALATEKPASFVVEEIVEKKVTSKKKLKKKVLEEVVEVPKLKNRSIDTIDWQQVLSKIRQTSMPLYSITNRADVEQNQEILNIHVTFELHKKKLESDSHRQKLQSILAKLYKQPPNEFVVTFGKRPPKNEQARAIADIMGGGEEVRV